MAGPPGGGLARPPNERAKSNDWLSLLGVSSEFVLVMFYFIFLHKLFLKLKLSASKLFFKISPFKHPIKTPPTQAWANLVKSVSKIGPLNEP